jgi:hypothetical protein
VSTYQDALRNILEKKGNYISMEHLDDSQQEHFDMGLDRSFLFNTTEDRNSPGGRHLSEKGNFYFGQVFTLNYLKSTFIE